MNFALGDNAAAIKGAEISPEGGARLPSIMSTVTMSLFNCASAGCKTDAGSVDVIASNLSAEEFNAGAWKMAIHPDFNFSIESNSVAVSFPVDRLTIAELNTEELSDFEATLLEGINLSAKGNLTESSASYNWDAGSIDVKATLNNK